LFQLPSVKGRVDLPDRLTTLMDDFEMNRTPKNVLILDKSAFKADPKLGEKMDILAKPLPEDSAANLIPTKLAKGNTASQTFRMVIRNEADAARLASYKGVMERSNNTEFPTKLIIDDRLGLLDPAIYSRGELVDNTYWTGTKPSVTFKQPTIDAKSVELAKAIKSGVDKGLVRTPKEGK
jgi:hypothetical protein